MHYAPDTVWGRTVDGDREIDWPTSDLSLLQRQVLADLGEPRRFADLVVHCEVDAPTLGRELTCLAEARLAAFQHAGAGSPEISLPRRGTPVNLPQAGAASGKPSPGESTWKPGPGAYAIAITLGFMAVVIVLA